VGQDARRERSCEQTSEAQGQDVSRRQGEHSREDEGSVGSG